MMQQIIEFKTNSQVLPQKNNDILIQKTPNNLQST
jgi:hypothetical protein